MNKVCGAHSCTAVAMLYWLCQCKVFTNVGSVFALVLSTTVHEDLGWTLLSCICLFSQVGIKLYLRRKTLKHAPVNLGNLRMNMFLKVRFSR